MWNTKIFLLITFFKIFRNDWAHTGNKYTNVPIKCQCAQSFLNILKKVINKKILYSCMEFMLKSSFYSVAFDFFGPSLISIPLADISIAWNLIMSCFVHDPLRGEEKLQWPGGFFPVCNTFLNLLWAMVNINEAPQAKWNEPFECVLSVFIYRLPIFNEFY